MEIENQITELYGIRKQKEVMERRERELRGKILLYLEAKGIRILREGDYTVQLKEKYVRRAKKDLPESSYDKSLIQILKIRHIKDVELK